MEVVGAQHLLTSNSERGPGSRLGLRPNQCMYILYVIRPFIHCPVKSHTFILLAQACNAFLIFIDRRPGLFRGRLHIPGVASETILKVAISRRSKSFISLIIELIIS